MVVKRSNKVTIDRLFDDLKKEVDETAGIIAQSYAKQGSEDIIEAWADTIIEILMSNKLTPSLKDSTIKRRERADKSVISPEHALLESAEWATYIEFRHTTVPSRNYDIIEVGVFDESSVIGHSSNITPKEIGIINEYGMSYVNLNGEIIEIPARPLFAYSAMDIGYEANKILTDAWQKVQVAYGREKRSITPTMASSSIVHRASKAAPNRYIKGTKNSGKNVTRVGKLFWSGGTLEFRWVDDSE